MPGILPILRTRRAVLVALLLVTAVSFGLRFGAISRLLPVHPEPDASLVWTYRALAGQPLTPDKRSHFGVYPAFLPRTLALLTAGDPMQPAPLEAPLEEHLDAASAPYLRLRILIAAISFLIAPLGFFLARRWTGDTCALLCAALLATALMPVAHASVAKPHAAAATFVCLALVLALRQVEAPSAGRILATAVAAALAIATMHTGFFVLFPLAVAAWFGRAPSPAVRAWAWIAPGLAVIAGLCFVPGGVSVEDGGVLLGQGHSIHFGSLTGGGLRRWPVYLWEHDPVLVVLGLAGLVLAVLSLQARTVVGSVWNSPRHRDALLLASFALPYVSLLSLDALVADRYLLPLYPVFALLATLAARACWRAFARRLPAAGPRRAAAQVAFCALVLALPAWIAARFTWLGRQPSTFEQLASWLERQPDAPSRRVLLSLSITPPLFPTEESLAQQLATTSGRSQPWFYYLGSLERLPLAGPRYDLRTIDPELYLRRPSPELDELSSWIDRQDPDWVVLENSRRMFAFPGGGRISAVVGMRAEIEVEFRGEPAHRFGEIPIDYQGARHMVERVWSARSFGPDLVVYRWPSR